MASMMTSWTAGVMARTTGPAAGPAAALSAERGLARVATGVPASRSPRRRGWVPLALIASMAALHLPGWAAPGGPAQQAVSLARGAQVLSPGWTPAGALGGGPALDQPVPWPGGLPALRKPSSLLRPGAGAPEGGVPGWPSIIEGLDLTLPPVLRGTGDGGGDVVTRLASPRRPGLFRPQSVAWPPSGPFTDPMVWLHDLSGHPALGVVWTGAGQALQLAAPSVQPVGGGADPHEGDRPVKTVGGGTDPHEGIRHTRRVGGGTDPHEGDMTAKPVGGGTDPHEGLRPAKTRPRAR